MAMADGIKISHTQIRFFPFISEEKVLIKYLQPSRWRDAKITKFLGLMEK